LALRVYWEMCDLEEVPHLKHAWELSDLLPYVDEQHKVLQKHARKKAKGRPKVWAVTAKRLRAGARCPDPAVRSLVGGAARRGPGTPRKMR